MKWTASKGVESAEIRLRWSFWLASEDIWGLVTFDAKPARSEKWQGIHSFIHSFVFM